MPNIFFFLKDLTLQRFTMMAALVVMVAVVDAGGGETTPGIAASGQGEAYSRALRDAEKERNEQAARLNNGDSWNVSAFLSIAALALAIGLTAWLTRRLQRRGWSGGTAREMRMLDRLPLGRQSTLFLVQVRNRQYCLAEHSQGVTLLAECPMEGNADTSASEPAAAGADASAATRIDRANITK